MKNFDDFEAFMKTDSARVHDAIVAKVRAAVDSAKIEDPIEEHVFYERALAEFSVMEILRAYHDWQAKE